MKRIICLLLMIVISLPLFSCGNVDNPPESSQNSENDPESTETAQKVTDPTTSKVKYEKIDYDLVAAGPTIAYAGVTSMWNDPSPYMGKVVKVTGTLGTYTDAGTGKVYYSCMLTDQTACCSQYIEFVLADKNYPKAGETITVVGVFGTYKEGSDTYIQLKDAQLL